MKGDEYLKEREKARMVIGRNLRKKLRETDMSMFELSKRIDSTPGCICNIAQGKSAPGAIILKRMAVALDCTTDELLKGVCE